VVAIFRAQVGLDLPLKLLVAEDKDGGCTISYNSPAYLRKRHDLPEGLMGASAVIAKLTTKTAE
jgi:uncharacterized protein (DUF302 family)